MILVFVLDFVDWPGLGTVDSLLGDLSCIFCLDSCLDGFGKCQLVVLDFEERLQDCLVVD